MSHADDRSHPYSEIASYVYMDELKDRGNASDTKIYSFVDSDILN